MENECDCKGSPLKCAGAVIERPDIKIALPIAAAVAKRPAQLCEAHHDLCRAQEESAPGERRIREARPCRTCGTRIAFERALKQVPNSPFPWAKEPGWIAVELDGTPHQPKCKPRVPTEEELKASDERVARMLARVTEERKRTKNT